jgi:TRAP-type C4-dicarboxylate transport system permease small subunit
MSETVPSPLLAREDYASSDAFAVDRALAPVRRVLRWTSIVLVAVMIALPAWQVVMREFFNLPFIGAEELTRFMLICTVFITLPYVIASGANIRLDEILQQFPKPVRQVVRVVIAVTGTAAYAAAAYAVAVATLRNLQNATPTLGIPYWIFFSASLVGFLVAGIETALQGYKLLTGRPPYLAFPDESAPDDIAALEAALVAEADRGVSETHR